MIQRAEQTPLAEGMPTRRGDRLVEERDADLTFELREDIRDEDRYSRTVPS